MGLLGLVGLAGLLGLRRKDDRAHDTSTISQAGTGARQGMRQTGRRFCRPGRCVAY